MFCELGLQCVVHLLSFFAVCLDCFLHQPTHTSSLSLAYSIRTPTPQTNTPHIVYIHTVTNAAIVNGLSGLPYLQHIVITHTRQRPLLLQLTPTHFPSHSGSTKCRSPSPCVPRGRRSAPQVPPPSGPPEAPRRSTDDPALKTGRDSGPTGSRADPRPPTRESLGWTDSTSASRPRRCDP